MSKIRSVGKCIFCSATYTNAGINKHLNAHLIKEVRSPFTGSSFHIRIEEDPFFDRLFFLNLWVDGEALMSEIDDFLRAIWLDCCGHSSVFHNPKQKKKYTGPEEDTLMDTKTKDLLTKGMMLDYEYDFGSTTSLRLKVLEQIPIEVPLGILLLSRNEPLEFLCSICESAPASVLCATCRDNNRFCRKCAKIHARSCPDFADYSALPVVNSPRMGVCGYEGGTIDKKRDGIFRAK